MVIGLKDVVPGQGLARHRPSAWRRQPLAHPLASSVRSSEASVALRASLANHLAVCATVLRAQGDARGSTPLTPAPSPCVQSSAAPRRTRWWRFPENCQLEFEKCQNLDNFSIMAPASRPQPAIPAHAHTIQRSRVCPTRPNGTLARFGWRPRPPACSAAPSASPCGLKASPCCTICCGTPGGSYPRTP